MEKTWSFGLGRFKKKSTQVSSSFQACREQKLDLGGCRVETLPGK
jgi:hypothetical protein